MPSRNNNQRTEFEGAGTKLLLAPGLIFTSVITFLLLCSDRKPWTSSGHFYNFVENNRATVQIIVQVFASIFGALNVYSVCCLISFSTRIHLSKGPQTLDHLGFWSALCLKHLDWSLPLRFLIPLTLFWTLTRVPAAIWAGALTPVEIRSNNSIVRNLSLPQYSPASEDLWGDLSWLKPYNVSRGPLGVFSYSPNYHFPGLILNHAASATSYHNASQPYKKSGNSQYSYIGRSYGVASSVGLVDLDWNNNTVLGYSFEETGYNTTVSCKFDDTSDWMIDPKPQVKSTKGATYPDSFLVSGYLPNGNWEAYAACGLFQSTAKIFALTGSYNRSGGNAFAIAAGSNYEAFNNIQCTVDFVPTMFTIAVNSSGYSIDVNSSDAMKPKDIEPSSRLANITMRMPTSLSQQRACDFYTSLVGDTFAQNVQSTDPDFIPSGGREDPYVSALVLQGVTDSLTSMLDNSLLAFSSAQLMIAKDTYDVKASVSLSAVRIGTSAYIYIITGINFAILLICLIELIRTRAWRGLTTFEYINIKSVIIGAWKGGPATAQDLRTLQDAQWDSIADRTPTGKVRVQLRGKGEEVKLVANYKSDSDDEKGTPRIWRRKKGGTGMSEMKALTHKEDSLE